MKQEPWQIVAYRLQRWKEFIPAPACSRRACRARNILHEPHLSDIRATPIGDLCISCWIDWEECGICGLAPAMLEFRFRGQYVCEDCLVPEIPSDSWRDWLLYFIYTPRSSLVQVLEDAFAEDFHKASRRACSSQQAPTGRMQEWSLTTVHAS